MRFFNKQNQKTNYWKQYANISEYTLSINWTWKHILEHRPVLVKSERNRDRFNQYSYFYEKAEMGDYSLYNESKIHVFELHTSMRDVYVIVQVAISQDSRY